MTSELRKEYSKQLLNLYTRATQFLLDYQITHNNFELFDSRSELNYIEFICASRTSFLPAAITSYFFNELDMDYELLVTELKPFKEYKIMCKFVITHYYRLPANMNALVKEISKELTAVK